MQYPNVVRHALYLLPLLILAYLPISAAESPPTGSIEGRVVNSRSGAVAENARISVEGTDLVTFTDADGAFRLNNLPPGEVRLRIFYTGFTAQFETVPVSNGQTTQRDITLAEGGPTALGTPAAVVKLDAFKVSEAREMEAAAIAINEQRFASNVKNVVSTDEFGAVAEGNVAEFLRYLPGLTVDLSGGDARTVSIDGAPAENTPVTLAGLSLPASNSTGRQVEVGMFNLNNISRIEVSLSPTPDSPGSALAGSINMIPRSSFERSRPVFNGSVYLMMRDDWIEFGKQPALYRDPRRVIHPGFDFSWVVPVNKRFGFSVSAGKSTQYSFQTGHTNTWAGLNVATNGNALPHTTVDRPYLSSYNITDSPKETARESLGLTLDLKLTARDRISLSQHFTSFNGWTAQRSIVFNPTQIIPGTFSPTFVQGAAGAGTINNTSGNGRVRETRIRMTTLNWRHDGELWKLDAGLGRAHGTDAIRARDKGLFQNIVSRRTGVTIGFDQISDTRPRVLTVTDGAGARVDPFNLSNYSLISVAETPNLSRDLNVSAFANARRDFHWHVPVTLRGGLDFRQSSRDIRTGAFTWNYRGSNIPGSAGPFLDPTTTQREGPYGFPAMQTVDYKGVLDFFKANPDQFVFDANANYRALVNNSKYAREIISAAYLRGDIALLDRRLNIVSGVRFEQTNIEANGPLTDLSRNVLRDGSGRAILNAAGQPVPITSDPLETARLTLIDRGTDISKEYLRMFPSLNASYNIRENLIARAAVSTSIGRPDFDQYAGGVSLPNLENPPSGTNRIAVNNAGIKPWTATSYRVRLEYYFKGVGQFALGGYRRDYENFFGNTIIPATPELLNLYALDATEYGAYDVATQYNVPGTVRTTGWDMSYKQSLTFLPPWARGLHAFGNISFRRTKTNDLGARGFNDIPKSGSWGISLTRPKFTARVNVSFRASQRQGRVTGVGIEPETFNFVPSRNTVDVLGEYHLWKQVSLFANLRNVGDVPNETVTEGPNTPDYALLRMRQRYGSLWTFGIKGTF